MIFNDIFGAISTDLEKLFIMQQKYVRIFRHEFPGLQLPFYPRGAGINDLVCGDREEQIPLNFCEIDWVVSGTCRFHFGDRSVLVHGGECFFWLPGERRAKYAVSNGRTLLYYATFDGDDAAGILQSFNYPRRALRAGECPTMLFMSLMHGLASTQESRYRSLLPIYLELMTSMVETTPASSDSTDTFADQCLYMIQSECTDCNFNVDTLAAKMGVHRSTIRRTVLRITGKTPVVYLEECRLRRAFELLKTTLLPVKEIADRSGFRRANYFCRMVRLATGLTPQEWRNRERGCHKN